LSDSAPSGGPSEVRSDYFSEASFDEMALSEPVRRAIAERGYERPTPVQSATVRPILSGKDVIVRSKTGTGKTAAFGIPIIERIPAGRGIPSALIMAPTRELAIQVAEEMTALSKPKGLRVVTIYGGASMGDQLEGLHAGAEIIVGTPGRIYDHIRRHTLDLSTCMVACLDEADEMLNMGFFEEVTRILDHLPDDCQQLLFSATVPADIEQIIREYLTDPETILLSGDEYRVDNIRNVLYHTNEAYPKPRNLLYMVEIEEPESAIVFCNTRSDTSLITAVLNRNGYEAELLNGELPQKERERVMAKVKRGEVRFMVATDIAARGIDISDLSHVINYSLPEDPAVYLHRAGRTGRIGKKGTALSLVTGAEGITLGVLQKKFGVVFEEKQMPTQEEARRLWTDRHVAELREGMNSSIFEAFIPLAQELRNRPDGDHLVAFALKYFFNHHRIEKVQDLVKAVHKLDVHEKKEQRVAPKREARPEGRSEGRERGSRDRGARSDRPDRGDRGERRPRREEQREPVTIAVTRVEPAAPVETQGPAEASNEPEATPGRPARSRIFVSAGEVDGADEAKVRETLAALAPGVEVDKVEIRRTHVFLEVNPADAERLVSSLSGKEAFGKTLAAEKARRRRR
jgi:ATP-dependent RNA helicase DeaD